MKQAGFEKIPVPRRLRPRLCRSGETFYQYRICKVWKEIQKEKEWSRHLRSKATPEKWQKAVHRSATVALWTIEGMASVTIALALAAIILSREGILAVVTPETIQRWFLEHGTSILIILVVWAVLWLALKKSLPPLVRHTIVRTKGESKEGIKKRTDTLVSVFMGAGQVIIALLVLFMLLSEVGIPIAPILAGFSALGDDTDR